MIATLLALAPPVPVGVFESWGAFRDGARCYAIAAPLAPVRSPASAAFASRFGRDRRSALFVRLSKPRREGSRVVLGIGERRFALSASATAAWAPDAATDHAIVAAIRGARAMSVASVSPRGPFADSYSLAGAATAIDAASLACARR